MFNSIQRWSSLAALGLALLAAGCSKQPTRVTPAAIDAAAAGKAAIAAYDKNGDGVISGNELDKCPALKSALKFYDHDGDGKVTAEAITARIQKWQASKQALVSVTLAIELDGQKLEGANVTLDPEPFLGPNLSPATGVTDGQGMADPRVEQTTLRGVSPGLYKLRISKKVDGRETIPARYNTETELGLEAAPGGFSFMKPREIKLSSKSGK